MPEAEQLRKRHVAYKLRIKDIINSSYIKSGNFPNYIEFNGREISRINVIGVVIDKSNFETYRSLVIEDGTEKISARIFEKNLPFESIQVGDVVIIIGRPREFLSEKYLLIEIIKKINNSWAKVRALELEKNNVHDKIIDENKHISDDSNKNKIVKLIKELDKGEGVSVEDIFSESSYNDKIIDTLLKEGNVFEVKPGKLKVLE